VILPDENPQRAWLVQPRYQQVAFLHETANADAGELCSLLDEHRVE
jgi:hypothetical protein